MSFLGKSPFYRKGALARAQAGVCARARVYARGLVPNRADSRGCSHTRICWRRSLAFNARFRNWPTVIRLLGLVA